jgi:hypothetical protein
MLSLKSRREYFHIYLFYGNLFVCSNSYIYVHTVLQFYACEIPKTDRFSVGIQFSLYGLHHMYCILKVTEITCI